MRDRFLYWSVLSLSGVLGCAGVGNEDSGRPEEAAEASFADPVASPSSQNAASNQAPRTMATATAPASAGPAPGIPSAGDASKSAPVVPSQEKFDAVGSNPFVVAARDPFSTFAADVDTASYDVFRRNTEHDTPVDKNSVRVEEFVNYFEYDYPAPAPSDEHPFAVDTALSQNPFGRDTLLVRVGIQARKPQPEDRKQANLVFLIDTSGSMASDDKLPLVKYLLTHSLDVLNADDKVSIVQYAGSTSLVLEPTQIVEKEKIAAAINSLTVGGGTNGSGGIQLAYAQAESQFLQDGINHVVLCTDGDFNIGTTSDSALVDLIEEKRQSGITLTALGFGIGNLNDSMMEKVSNAGNGMYSVITSQTQASRYAEDRMLRTFLHVAKDMKIQVEWNPEKVEAYRLIGYEDRAIADRDFRNDVVDAGEVGAGHRVTALYEIVPKGKKIPTVQGAPVDKTAEKDPGEREIQADDMVLVKVRYKQPGAGETDAAKEVVFRSPGTEVPSFDEADDDLRYSVAVAAFSEILKDSPYATPGELGLIREVFASQQERDIERTEFLALFDRALELSKP
jgi:Ca-activated chloride channel homolog